MVENMTHKQNTNNFCGQQCVAIREDLKLFSKIRCIISLQEFPLLTSETIDHTDKDNSLHHDDEEMALNAH